MKSCFHSRNEKDLGNIRMSRYQFVINNESSNNTDVKADINQLCTNTMQFLENIVSKDEI